MSKVMQEPRRDPEAQQSEADADMKAFTRIVHEHYAAVLSQAQRILHDPAEAEDCAQEAFAEASRLLHTLENPRALAGWLRGIVRHRCLRRLRRRDFLLVSLGEDMEALPGPAGAATDELRERLERVRGLIEELPRQEREVVVLFYLKECSQSEIAAFLRVSVGSVNNRLHQARQRLKKWENQMHTSRLEAQATEPERASRVGSVVAVNGPIVHVRFEPHAPLDLFDALVIDEHGFGVKRGRRSRSRTQHGQHEAGSRLATAGGQHRLAAAQLMNAKRSCPAGTRGALAAGGGRAPRPC